MDIPTLSTVATELLEAREEVIRLEQKLADTLNAELDGEIPAREVARYLGIGYSRISELRHGRRSFNDAILKRLAGMKGSKE